MGKSLDKNYWEERYNQNRTGWDIGFPSTPLKTYIDQLENKNLKILIPGCGNAYEAEYLHQHGFKNVFVLDLANHAFENLLKRAPNFPKNHLIQSNFFEHQDQYDLILEQTFFCSLFPEQRDDYAKKMNELLNKKGKLVGVLFNKDFPDGNPPFGGCESEYRKHFAPYFRFNIFETAYNSIKPREGSELFIHLTKK